MSVQFIEQVLVYSYCISDIGNVMPWRMSAVYLIIIFPLLLCSLIYRFCFVLILLFRCCIDSVNALDNVCAVYLVGVGLLSSIA